MLYQIKYIVYVVSSFIFYLEIYLLHRPRSSDLRVVYWFQHVRPCPSVSRKMSSHHFNFCAVLLPRSVIRSPRPFFR